MTPRDVDLMSAVERRAFIRVANEEIRQANREASRARRRH